MSRIHADAPPARPTAPAGSAAPPGSTAPAVTARAVVASAGPLDRVARSLVLRRIEHLQLAPITFHEGGAATTIGVDAAGEPCSIDVHAPRFWRRLATGGSLGFAESWMRGEWTCDDLPRLLRLFVRDAARADVVEGGLARLGRMVASAGHRLASNTRRGSRRNISAHYDLGNDFFALFLDPSMTYSAARFERPDMTLAEAQAAKLERMCRTLDLRPGQHVLEIGTGWGSFAMHAAEHHGCRVTTTTISREQHDHAVRRIREAGLADRVTVVMQDYRDLQGTYDAVASIEMIEAVGHAFLPAYFGAIARRLRPGGRACVQAISMPDHRYDEYRRRADFIQRYVFPGSCCPSIAAMGAAMARGSDLRITGLDDMGLDYVRTLRAWSAAFEDRLEDVRRLGHDERFIRLWRYYLAYCEAGFAERYISVAQIAMSRVGGPPAPRLDAASGSGGAAAGRPAAGARPEAVTTTRRPDAASMMRAPERPERTRTVAPTRPAEIDS